MSSRPCCDAGEASDEVFEAVAVYGDDPDFHDDDASGTAARLCDDCADRIEVIENDALGLLTSGPCAPFLSAL